MLVEHQELPIVHYELFEWTVMLWANMLPAIWLEHQVVSILHYELAEWSVRL